MKITERNGEKRRKLNEIIVRNDRKNEMGFSKRG